MEPFYIWRDYLDLNPLVRMLAREAGVREAAVLRCGREACNGRETSQCRPIQGELAASRGHYMDHGPRTLPPQEMKPTLLCTFCKHNGESKQVYSGHSLKDGQGHVQCPILQHYVCPQCGATGVHAHTRRFCPMTEKGYSSVYQGTYHNSTGRRKSAGYRSSKKEDPAPTPTQGHSSYIKGRYIFGEFSDDEVKQFFVTASCTVELPPFNETALCSPQSTRELQDGEEHQRIEFGGNEAIDTGASLLNNISSTLNPYAPEFIQSCTPTQKTHDDILHENSYDAIGCKFTESALPQDGSGNANSDGTSGSGQRRRRKKKQRPPGYYSYLEDFVSVPTETLVNGHAISAGHNSISTAELAEDMPISSASPVTLTCNIPDHFLDFNNEALSDDASFSNALDQWFPTPVPKDHLQSTF
ncbi:LOW QUALITY PROTEIN: ubiquitin carboxyl-terminal hydrolase 10-A-like [Ascaphus truei]|uniref:LOW QUALITY PROTEIN: ubiquitin carboxyl-terminal hydrolase 10-A-like n=1 Tax=Ascaphus truei TaxID=8439 RepID=UPI003F59B2A2